MRTPRRVVSDLTEPFLREPFLREPFATIVPGADDRRRRSIAGND